MTYKSGPAKMKNILLYNLAAAFKKIIITLGNVVSIKK